MFSDRSTRSSALRFQRFPQPTQQRPVHHECARRLGSWGVCFFLLLFFVVFFVFVFFWCVFFFAWSCFCLVCVWFVFLINRVLVTYLRFFRCLGRSGGCLEKKNPGFWNSESEVGFFFAVS